MRKRIKLLALLLCLVLTVFAQKSNEQMGGIYYAYPEYKAAKYTAVPEGFIPFYISHYGRHGSRWMTSDARYEWIISQFALQGTVHFGHNIMPKAYGRTLSNSIVVGS